MCFFDNKKAFECVDHETMWIILNEMGVPTHLVLLLRNVYANQKAAVKTEFRERRKSSTSGKVCDRVASCLLCFSTLLYTEKIMI